MADKSTIQNFKMTNQKTIAPITGVSGRDGAYLIEFLLKNWHDAHRIKRRASLFSTGRIDLQYHDVAAG